VVGTSEKETHPYSRKKSMTNQVFVRTNVQQLWHQPVLVVAGILVAVALEVSGGLPYVEQAVTNLYRPLLVGTREVSQWIETPVSLARRTTQQARRIQKLEQEYAYAVAEVGRLAGVEAENQELRRLLENTDRQLRESRVASSLLTLTRPAIGAGSQSGISVGDEVVAQNVLVGSITEVTPTVSFLTLLTQPDHQPVVVKTSAGAQGLVVGTGRGLKMTEIPLDQPMQVGDSVLTAGQAGIRADLTIGRVVRINHQAASPVKEAQIEQLVDFYQTKVVEVLL